MSASFAPAAPPPALPTGGMETSKDWKLEIISSLNFETL